MSRNSPGTTTAIRLRVTYTEDNALTHILIKLFLPAGGRSSKRWDGQISLGRCLQSSGET